MIRIVAPLATFMVFGMGVGIASAASPTYCALFAREFVEHAAEAKQSPPSKLVHDRAYHKCLNLDEEPQLPTAYADPATDGHGQPFVVEEQTRSATATVPSVSTPPNPPNRSAPPPPSVEKTTSTAALQPAETPRAQQSTRSKLRSWMGGLLGKFRTDPSSSPSSSPQDSVLGDRALTMTASQRAAHCAKYFPKSYDPKTGTVIPYETGVRTKC